MSKVVIKNTLDAFFSVEEDSRMIGLIDDVDTKILAEAIDQALEKEKRNANTN